MYIFRLSFVLLIQKLSAYKEFKLVKHRFGQKIGNMLRTPCVKFENRNNFILTQRKIQVSHSLVIAFQWVFILLVSIAIPVNPLSS